jgi:threonine/homoserine/homoserine lactone efflux protein
MSLLTDLGFGLVLGFSLTIPPGPMNALIASTSARSYRGGVVTGFGALSADLVLGGIVFALYSVVDLAPFVRWVYAVGAVVMVYFGLRIVRASEKPEASEEVGVRTYARALALGVSNPFQIVWWITAGLAFAYLGGPVLFVGLFGAIALWVVAFPLAVHTGAKKHPSARRPIAVGSALILFGFAVYFAVLAAYA